MQGSAVLNCGLTNLDVVDVAVDFIQCVLLQPSLCEQCNAALPYTPVDSSVLLDRKILGSSGLIVCFMYGSYSIFHCFSQMSRRLRWSQLNLSRLVMCLSKNR